jgi:hypothetical protein
VRLRGDVLGVIRRARLAFPAAGCVLAGRLSEAPDDGSAELEARVGAGLSQYSIMNSDAADNVSGARYASRKT